MSHLRQKSSQDDQEVFSPLATVVAGEKKETDGGVSETERRKGDLELPDMPSKKENILKGREGAVRFAVLAILADVLLWTLCYWGISIMTGRHGICKLNQVILPVMVLVSALSLIRGYGIRTNYASLRYASEHLIACLATYPVAAFLLFAVNLNGGNACASKIIFSASLCLFCGASLLARRYFWFSMASFRSKASFLVIVDRELGSTFYQDYRLTKQHQGLLLFSDEECLLGEKIDGDDSERIALDNSHIIPILKSDSAALIEAVVIAARFSTLSEDLLKDLGQVHFREMPVYSLVLFYEKYWFRTPIHLIGAAWPFETNYVLVQNSMYSNLKRSLDLLSALVTLLVLFPLLLLIAVLIRIFDGAPVIFSQQRMGCDEQPFRLYKFRTMHAGSHRGDRYTRDGDPRVTPLGAFLRKTRLDELPQLWNVLKGDMSVIGPRAEWVKLVEEYQEKIPNYHLRHLVRPGITGWAQVNYPYGESLEDTLQKLSYDLYYIRNFSMRLDAEVALKTLYVIFAGRGR